MSNLSLTADQARHRLYEVMKQDLPLEEKAEQALSIGEQYPRVENGHVTRIDYTSGYWKALLQTTAGKERERTYRFVLGGLSVIILWGVGLVAWNLFILISGV